MKLEQHDIDAIADAVIARLPKPAADVVPLFMRIGEYAERLGFSRRHVEGLIADGLPTVGAGNGRRIDVQRADEWIRRERGAGDTQDAVALGRAAARR